MSHFPAKLLPGLCALFVSASLPAQVLLLNPGSLTGTSNTFTGSAPYTVAGNSVWNNGLTTYTGQSGVLQYADDTDATGVTVLGDGADVSGATSISFTTRTGNSVSGTASGVFSADPARDAVYTGTSSQSATGIFALKISGLTLNTVYDVFVVAGYTGTSTGNQPGGATPSRQAVFGFAAEEADSLVYNNGSITVGAFPDTYTSYQPLLNGSNLGWVENTNYERFQVTITETDPTLYILVSGQKSLAGMGGTSTEARPWLNLVQIVAIPEPGVGAGLAFGLGLMAIARRRRVC